MPQRARMAALAAGASLALALAVSTQVLAAWPASPSQTAIRHVHHRYGHHQRCGHQHHGSAAVSTHASGSGTAASGGAGTSANGAGSGSTSGATKHGGATGSGTQAASSGGSSTNGPGSGSGSGSGSGLGEPNHGGASGSGTHAASSGGSGANGSGSGSGSGSGAGSGSGSGSGGTFRQGTGSPSVSGGLQLGGKIDGLTIVRVVHLTATAYGATAQDNYPYGATDAFGLPLRPGDVAVDPGVISLNTRMYVTGYSSPNLPAGGELAVARDTGGAIKGARIDMYINSTIESVINNFGIQHVTAYILG